MRLDIVTLLPAIYGWMASSTIKSAISAHQKVGVAKAEAAVEVAKARAKGTSEAAKAGLRVAQVPKVVGVKTLTIGKGDFLGED